MNREIAEQLSNPLLSLGMAVYSRLPNLAAAFVFLLLGLVIARGLRTFLERVLDRTHLDDYTSKVGINEVLTRLGLGRSPAYVLSFLAYWFVLLVFIVFAANAVNLTVVSELLQRFMMFLPSLISAILIAFGGLLFSNFLSEVVRSAAQANNVRGGAVLASFTYAVVLIFSVLLALEQLGVQLDLVTSSLQIILASIGLGAAIAFGLGGKGLAEEQLRNFFRKGEKN